MEDPKYSFIIGPLPRQRSPSRSNELWRGARTGRGRRRMAGEVHQVHVVGPERSASRWIFLCPVCDADRVELGEAETPECTTSWLDGRALQFDGVDWTCWERGALDDRDLSDKQKRFLCYSAIARELGAVGRRVDLPACVKAKIESQHGESQTGFRGD